MSQAAGTTSLLLGVLFALPERKRQGFEVPFIEAGEQGSEVVQIFQLSINQGHHEQLCQRRQQDIFAGAGVYPVLGPEFAELPALRGVQEDVFPVNEAKAPLMQANGGFPTGIFGDAFGQDAEKCGVAIACIDNSVNQEQIDVENIIRRHGGTGSYRLWIWTTPSHSERSS